jgi:uncharacterized protein YjiS (DUF1127 family)
MSTTTNTFGLHSFATEDIATGSAKTFYQRLVDARFRQARAQVSGVLARMSDEQLAELGFNAAQIRDVRAAGPAPMSFLL